MQGGAIGKGQFVIPSGSPGRIRAALSRHNRNVDLTIVTFLAQHRVPALTAVARWAMDFGTNDAIQALTGFVGLAVVAAKRWWWQGMTIGASVLLAQALARALKLLIARPRPPADLAVANVGAFSMPSTVAAMTAALAVALYAVLPWPPGYRGWAVAALAAGLALIGVAMVYLGAHWPTDVLAGWPLGLVVGVAVVQVTRTIRRATH
ncbi:phosphatase PAP2 family protein [Nocardia arthritidis]|uniref:Phosphatase PAP2 family protein n=1 Tax=Nocardia arthritidis TaxID=228602 RepID=A0A6G9Y9B2_9NOCA|nr:phosphatase PAP2 family protein [Nocardia arthritidis]